MGGGVWWVGGPFQIPAWGRPTSGVRNLATPWVNLGLTNNLTPNLLILDIHPTGQAPKRRDTYFTLFGLHLPPYDIDLGGDPLKGFGPQVPEFRADHMMDNNPTPMHNRGVPLSKFGS